MRLNDYVLIDELSGIPPTTRLQRLNALGDEAAAHIRLYLTKALERFEQVYLLCHVPPTRESCTYQGTISDDEWMPHFSCKAIGVAILEIMPKYPEQKLTVLCGHTHDAGETDMLPTATVITAGATYHCPGVARVLEI